MLDFVHAAIPIKQGLKLRSLSGQPAGMYLVHAAIPIKQGLKLLVDAAIVL